MGGEKSGVKIGKSGRKPKSGMAKGLGGSVNNKGKGRTLSARSAGRKVVKVAGKK